MKRLSRLFLLPLLSAAALAAGHDIVIYGGTSAGVIAAVQAKKMGKHGDHRRARTSISADSRAAGWASPTRATRR